MDIAKLLRRARGIAAEPPKGSENLVTPPRCMFFQCLNLVRTQLQPFCQEGEPGLTALGDLLLPGSEEQVHRILLFCRRLFGPAVRRGGFAGDGVACGRRER